jgi:hypothetical protein
LHKLADYEALMTTVAISDRLAILSTAQPLHDAQGRNGLALATTSSWQGAPFVSPNFIWLVMFLI